jgi:hypothetical protein
VIFASVQYPHHFHTNNYVGATAVLPCEMVVTRQGEPSWCGRPMHDHWERPESHPFNPVLAALRTFPRGRFTIAVWRGALDNFDAFGGFMDWEQSSHPYHVLTLATPEQVDHARRVLARLEALGEVA